MHRVMVKADWKSLQALLTTHRVAVPMQPDYVSRGQLRCSPTRWFSVYILRGPWNVDQKGVFILPDPPYLEDYARGESIRWDEFFEHLDVFEKLHELKRRPSLDPST